MIDMTDIPASWAGREIRVYRPGMEITGVVDSIQSVSEDLLRTLASGVIRRLVHINISLVTREGPLEFSNLKPGSYNIDLIEEN